MDSQVKDLAYGVRSFSPESNWFSLGRKIAAETQRTPLGVAPRMVSRVATKKYNQPQTQTDPQGEKTTTSPPPKNKNKNGQPQSWPPIKPASRFRRLDALGLAEVGLAGDLQGLAGLCLARWALGVGSALETGLFGRQIQTGGSKFNVMCLKQMEEVGFTTNK